jgi:hypothetical protein
MHGVCGKQFNSELIFVEANPSRSTCSGLQMLMKVLPLPLSRSFCRLDASHIAFPDDASLARAVHMSEMVVNN